MTFPEWLRGSRRLYGLSSMEVAHDLGVSTALISQMEHGKRAPSDQMMERMAEYFDMPKRVIARMREECFPGMLVARTLPRPYPERADAPKRCATAVERMRNPIHSRKPRREQRVFVETEDGRKEVFESVQAAAKYCGVCNSTIVRALEGNGVDYMERYGFRVSTPEEPVQERRETE